MRILTKVISLGLLSLVAAGCGSADRPTAPLPPAAETAAGPSTAASSALLLAAAPADSKGVIALRDAAKDGDEIVIEGRIGGDVDPWVKGRAAFQIVDHSLVPCSERAGDDCPTPWDYCCDADALPKSKAMVKFVDAEGKTVGTDARELLGVKELQTVVIKGTAKRDDAGNLTVLASGLYVKPQAPKAAHSENTK